MKMIRTLSVCALVVGSFATVSANETHKPVTIIVRVPAEATLELNGQKADGAGAERRFVTPPIEVGTKYPYTVKAVWTVNGKEQATEMKINITGGQTHEVQFTSAAAGGSGPEQEVLSLVNAERARYGLAPMVWNEVLGNAARMHSANMARQGVLSHDLNGSFVGRVQAAGGGVFPGGENIAQGQNSAREAMQSWMGSDGHRANILNGGFTSLGVGVSTGSGGMYWTQVFGR